MDNCPCGHPLKSKPVVRFGVELSSEVVYCLCGRERRIVEQDEQRADFVQFTRGLIGKKVPKTCKLNETSQQLYKQLADSL